MDFQIWSDWRKTLLFGCTESCEGAYVVKISCQLLDVLLQLVRRLQPILKETEHIHMQRCRVIKVHWRKLREDGDVRGQVSTLKVTLTAGQCSECLTAWLFFLRRTFFKSILPHISFTFKHKKSQQAMLSPGNWLLKLQ